jgi:gamma-glutamylputrescine oxidase
MPDAYPKFHARTWYQDRYSMPEFSPPEGAFDTDVVIIGAGLGGLSTALSLLERDQRNVMVLEGGQPGEGASGRNGGFVFGGFSLGAAAMARRIGRDAALDLQAATREAVDRVRARCESLDVALDGEGVLLADWFRNDRGLRRLADAFERDAGQRMHRLDVESRRAYVDSTRYGGALLEPGAFHFNPLAYVGAVAMRLRCEGVPVHGNAPVRSLTRDGATWVVETDAAKVRARRVVIATGGYDRGLVPALARSIQPIGTYIAVTEPLPGRIESLIPGGAAIYDTRFAFDYYRRIGDRLLWGGRISIADRHPDGIERLMRHDLARVFPTLRDVTFSHAWGGWMSYARHQMPIVGEVEPGLWSAIAFGGHGMAPTCMVGDVVAEALCGESRRCELLQAWGCDWAGGILGRGAVQAKYWWLQCKDAVRAAVA